MVYGFAVQVWDCEKKSMVKTTKAYEVWINTFNYLAKNAVIRTLDGRLFNVKVFKIGCDFFFYNGWQDMITALKIPSKSWLVFQHEEALACFRIFYFYQDISLAPFDYFYYKS
ncbi:putative DNA-binding pseudobarrel domain superfamily [Helianthus anomalus]